MHESVKRGFGVLRFLLKLLPSLENLANKGWAIRVPAAAVIPEPQVVTAFIGLKGFVAGLISS